MHHFGLLLSLTQAHSPALLASAASSHGIEMRVCERTASLERKPKHKHKHRNKRSRASSPLSPSMDDAIASENSQHTFELTAGSLSYQFSRVPEAAMFAGALFVQRALQNAWLMRAAHSAGT